MDKIIINVGRQIGSGGRVIARLLAEEFGCKFCDREILNLAAKESGFSAKFFEKADESKGFLRSLFRSVHPMMSHGTDIYGNQFSQEGLFRFQSIAILKAAEEGSCVFVGRCADYILRDMDNVVNVFITADMEDRINAVSSRLGCGKDEARKKIVQGENNRASYYNYYTGKKWGHSDGYDLTVNSSRLGIEGTAAFISDFIRKHDENRHNK